MTAAESLRAAKALIDTPAKWCRGSYTRNAGRQHCAMGAVEYYGCTPHGMVAALYAAAAELGNQSVTAFNDTHTHAECMTMFDRAIKIAEARDAA